MPGPSSASPRRPPATDVQELAGTGTGTVAADVRPGTGPGGATP
ncbi:hypothetical protein OG818_35695 [Streptomyces virginiae]|nr:hypothetical protein [Streptomyces virginiae]MCX4721062.1 hypothetical protein [Streptomyces virginiae]